MVYLATVRFGRMNSTENFMSQVPDLRSDLPVIIRTSRGVEYGEVAGPVTEQDRDDIRGLGEILRKASVDDLKIIEHIHSVKEPDEMEYCNGQIRSFKLPMKLTAVEHLYGGDKIIFYFLADGRVDFRALVKDLARKYRTRIEMRQIGVRDEARLLADYEHCGRELCCRTFMNNLEPVTMRMAKLQKTTLDPSKISGHCGRLMCCLRFEDEVYADLKREVPHKGTWVRTDELEGEVIDYNILSQICTVETRDGDRVKVHVEKIVERRSKKGRSSQKPRKGGRRREEEGDRKSAAKGPEADRPDEKKSAPETNATKPDATAEGEKGTATDSTAGKDGDGRG